MKAGMKCEARACQYKAMGLCHPCTFHSIEKKDALSLRMVCGCRNPIV